MINSVIFIFTIDCSTVLTLCFFDLGVTGELLETRTFDMWAGGNEIQEILLKLYSSLSGTQDP